MESKSVNTNCTYGTSGQILNPDSLHICLPSVEQPAEFTQHDTRLEYAIVINWKDE